MDRKKVVHQLDTPYSAIQWPSIRQEDQDAILELLCSYLAPLGVHRNTHVVPSKGKRDCRKRKRGESKHSEAQDRAPPRPELARYVDVGLSSISKHLQEATNIVKSVPTSQGEPGVISKMPQTTARQYSAIFVAKSGASPAFHSHFPQMVAASALSAGSSPRLIGFSRTCEDRLSVALGIPRVTSIAIDAQAPQSAALLNFIRDRVAPVEVDWLQESRLAVHSETKINSVSTSIGVSKKIPTKKS